MSYLYNFLFHDSEELNGGVQYGKPVLKKMRAVCEGDSKLNYRTVLLTATTQPENHFLSVEEQVDCLVDMATDDNILGRTWVGWRPWI